jgi:uncharacterized protein
VITVAVLGLVGWELDLKFSMLPTLLIAVGVADSVHIVSEFRAYHAELGDRRSAVRRTMYLVGTPSFLTSLTTAAGFDIRHPRLIMFSPLFSFSLPLASPGSGRTRNS